MGTKTQKKEEKTPELKEQSEIIKDKCAPVIITSVKEGDIKAHLMKKSKRKRKRHYFNAIREQMEFYFGDANLTKDRFLRKLIEADPCVPLKTFLTFNKMKALTTNIEDIIKALNDNELLEIDEVAQTVKRKKPIPEERNVDEKTLYIEGLPPQADHDWVRRVFEKFGKVTYVSLPKYKRSRRIKEFGFVEYESESSIEKAIKTFEEFDAVLCTLSQDPAELSSVKAFIKEQAETEEETRMATDKIQSEKECKKRKATSSHEELSDSEEIDALNSKRVKLETSTKDSATLIDNKNDKNGDQSEIKNNENENDENKKSEKGKDKNEKSEDEKGAEQILVDKLGDGNAKKKRRKKSKQSYMAAKMKFLGELSADVGYYELKILPKKDWKRLRNKYLNLQREAVRELKRKAWLDQQQAKEMQNDENGQGNNQLSPCKRGEHQIQKMNMNFYGANAEDAQSDLKEEDTKSVSKPPLFSYEPGLIVQINLLEPCVNIKEFKTEMRQHTSVKYVDIKEGAQQAHIRLETPDKALDFVKRVHCTEYQCKILVGEAETEYWHKIEKDREQKLNKQVIVRQKRGREKINKLINTHIYFKDDNCEAIKEEESIQIMEEE